MAMVNGKRVYKAIIIIMLALLGATLLIACAEEEKAELGYVYLIGEYKTEYDVGEAVNVNGMTMRFVYMDFSQVDYPVYSSMVKGFDSSTIGEKNVAVKFMGQTAYYTVNVSRDESFSVVFYGMSDKVLSTQTVQYGHSAEVPPETDYKVDGYEFLGWTTQAYQYVTEDLHVRASFDRISCNVYFIVPDTADQIRTVYYGEAITDVPTPPEKEGFTAAWDVTDFSRITADMEVRVVYTEIA